jgi:hypothetical protein
MITAAQIKALHVTRNQLYKASGEVFDEQQWRILLRNIGRVAPDANDHVSAKALDNAGFDRVMAYMRAHLGKSTRPDNTRITFKIERLYAEYSKLDAQPMELLGIAYQATGLRVQRVADLPVTSGRKVIEALKSILKRTAGTDAGQEAQHGGSDGSDAQSDD